MKKGNKKNPLQFSIFSFRSYFIEMSEVSSEDEADGEVIVQFITLIADKA